MKPRGILKWKIEKGRKIPYAMGMMYETAEAKKFKKDMVKLIKQAIKEQNFELKPRDKYSFVHLYWTWFFKATNTDTNNRVKCPIDAITLFGETFKDLKIWDDDNISMNKDVKIYYDSKNPRVQLEIRYAPDIGIFNNQEEYNQFINTYCNNCKKGNKLGEKGGCSVYKNMMESRIQEEIPMNTEEERNNKKCLKFKEG